MNKFIKKYVSKKTGDIILYECYYDANEYYKKKCEKVGKIKCELCQKSVNPWQMEKHKTTKYCHNHQNPEYIKTHKTVRIINSS